MAFKPNRFKSALVVAAIITVLFGGLFALIGADYAATKTWGNILTITGAVFLGSFALFFLIWFVSDKRGK